METTDTLSTSVELHHLIAGSWREGSGATRTSLNPARPEEIVATYRQAETTDVYDAMSAARAAARAWSQTPIHERGAVLLRAASIIEADTDTLGLELTREEGKTLSEGIAEVSRAVRILRYWGNEGDRMAGESYASPRRGERIFVTRKPLGVVGVVTPFNFPIAIPAWKIAPALVYGNTVVWKPSSDVPLLAYRLAEALTTAGLPDGVLNLFIGPGSLGNDLLEHPELDGLTFTGSTEVGLSLASKAASKGIPMQAEMGGKNASVVLEDADLDLAVEEVIKGAFRSTGQKCTATSRLIIAESVADEFLARLVAQIKEWRVGDPSDPAMHMGPLVSSSAAARVREGISRAIQEGAQVVYNPGDEPLPPVDSYVAPTVLELPPGEAALANSAWHQELFGPVLTVRRVRDSAEAFRLAGDSEFGLSCAVFSQDITRVLEAVEGIDVGVLHINSESAGSEPHVPFGGAKKSGYGPMEQGGAAKEFFTHTTTAYISGGHS
ncbi:aldehyde dehydrogenase family protein [Enteractinococcus fodinae]|uniref:Aldehyde dehydrogenase (NAD+) n=1 Tax=Enteractinococcus fodinae TaxID=684663 RepID=A0ABU2B5A0_9MICC|nr:aldehyde dehydrogenase family protein [Enteractinococcus fodinae]MDR7348436.1 aldehyde dehydrogenase (NAD+) [Enteractinococcus fodinae]